MGRDRHRAILLIAAFALMISSCSDDDTSSSTSTLIPETSSTTSTTPASTTSTSSTTTTTIEETTTSSTTTTVPSAPLRAEEGDRNEIVEAVQFLLACNGADIAVDGVYGPGTRTAVEDAQERLGVAVDGIAGNETIAALSRSCDDARPLASEGALTLVGNVSPSDPEFYELTLVAGTTLTVTAGTAFTITLRDADGDEIDPESRGTWVVEESADHLLEVSAESGPRNFSIDVELRAPEPETGEWILATDGISYGDTKLELGDNAGTVIDQVFEFLGHGIRGRYDEFDTDWYTIDEPQPIGLRGVFIEGLAFLFFGPEKLPGMAAKAGKLYRNFRKATFDLSKTITDEVSSEKDIGEELTSIGRTLKEDITQLNKPRQEAPAPEATTADDKAESESTRTAKPAAKTGKRKSTGKKAVRVKPEPQPYEENM